MTPISRLSFFAAALCALAFLFAAPVAALAQEREVGYVKIAGSGTVSINGKTQGNGAKLRCGDRIETTESVEAHFTTGPAYIIDAGTRMRITCKADGSVQFLVTVGGIHLFDAAEDVLEQIPYNAALGVGNNTFPSIGGGSSDGGGKIPIFNSMGVLIGYAVTDSQGRVVAYTTTTGGVLAITTPNGRSVSSVFGAGAVGASLP